MGRHADSSAIPRRLPAVLIAAGAVVVLVAGGLVWWLTSGDDGADCATRSTVAVTVAPELAGLTKDLLSDPDALDAGGCVTAEVTAQEPLQTAGDLSALDDEVLPDVWVPDSSLWTARVDGVQLEHRGSMALSPVVLTSSRAVVELLGWTDTQPSWSEALAVYRPLAMPDLAASAEGLAALAALGNSMGGGEQGDNAIVQAVLAGRASAVSPAEVLAEGGANSAEAALAPVSEQDVFAANAGSEDSALLAVYPSEGSPSLDYPVLEVGVHSGAETTAIDAIVSRLTSEDAQAAVREAGFRDPAGTAPPRAAERGIAEEAPEVLPLDPAEVQALFARLSSLAAPSRILAAFDVSTSMEAPVGDGTRATLARDAAKSALALVPGDYAVGLWTFAYQLQDGQDWAELVPIRELDTLVDGRTQREILAEQLESIPTRLTPGGTGLYDTTLAAVRAARENYDPTAVNSVLLLTDGTNEDDEAGISLDGLLAQLAQEADPDRPVKVIGVALGPDADLAALQQIADATGGAAYSAVDENDLQTVLFDALRQRS